MVKRPPPVGIDSAIHYFTAASPAAGARRGEPGRARWGRSVVHWLNLLE